MAISSARVKGLARCSAVGAATKASIIPHEIWQPQDSILKARLYSVRNRDLEAFHATQDTSENILAASGSESLSLMSAMSFPLLVWVVPAISSPIQQLYFSKSHFLEPFRQAVTRIN